jgi:NadR type nicotinamide-nucleotide adenylyltransferase
VIDRALALCDEVVVISYSKPELPGCAPDRRARWLAARFPQTRRLVVTDAALAAHRGSPELDEVPSNDADPATHRRFVAHLCRCILGVEIDAVFTSEDYGDGFATMLEAEQRRHRHNAPAVTHICVDRARQTVPVSATTIRADVHAQRRWLSPEVHASFVKRVCILGGESSGKSMLAERLAMALETVHVAEYGRELWERQQGVLAFDDLLAIGERQVALEDEAALVASEFLICDTSPLTTLFYSRHLFDRADPALERLATARTYDLSVLCAPDFPFVQDGTRQNAAFRLRQHEWYVAQLAARGDVWMLAEGAIDERVQAVRAFLTARVTA